MNLRAQQSRDFPALRDWRIKQGGPLSAKDTSAEILLWQDSSTPLRISEFSIDDVQGFRLQMNNSFAADVLPDNSIVTRINARIDQITIDHFLADQVVPRVLSHAGSFVFHAGAVNVGGAALVFLGASGRGKSTLVTSFDQAGVGLIGDDAMVLSMDRGTPHIRPVYRSLRLFPDSLAALLPGSKTAGPVAHYTTKERIDVDIGEDEISPLPIRAIFSIAAAHHKATIASRQLAPANACMLLVESSFALDPADLGQAKQRLMTASSVAERLPAFEISYPRDYARLPDVRRAILDQVAALEAE